MNEITLYKQNVLSELKNNKVDLDAEQNQNMLVAVQLMDNAIKQQGITWKDVDQNNINRTLEMVAIFNLNGIAIPSECYIILNKVYGKDEKGNKDYGKVSYEFSFAPQGAGQEKMVRQFGADVKTLYPAWEVMEYDDFKYPHYKGAQIEPPEWTPTGKGGRCVRIVYVVELTNGNFTYLISERENVKKNLMAHVSRNLQYDKKDANEIIKKIDGETLDEALRDKDVIKTVTYTAFNKEQKVTAVSPAWYNPQSMESMIITKMKNNVLKKFPKRFTNSFIKSAYDNTMKYDEDNEINEADKKVIDVSIEQNVKEDIKKNANTLPSPTPDILKKTEVKEEKKEVAVDGNDDDLAF